MRRDKNEVRSGQEAGFSAEPTRIDMQSSTRSLDDTARQTSTGRRIVGVLASGLGRRSSSHYSPTDSPNSPSLLVRRQFAFPILAVLAVAALGLWLLLPGGALRAQESGAIEYAENGTGSVAVFTATDPELAGAITWSLATGDDAGDAEDAEDFKIDKASGVLSFMKSPDYETPGDADGNNQYTVMVVATDADGMTTNEDVTVNVTNVEEAGKVTLDTVAPYPGIDLMATLADSDKVVDGSEEWQWSRSASENGSYAAIEDADEATYNPTSGDVGYFLRATVAYDDEEGEGKSMEATSAHEVQAVNVPNNAPLFPDQNPDEDGDQSDTATRMVVENTDSGEDVGDPVAAGDANDDILTYTLGDDNADDSFDIDQATGQIKTKADVDTEATPSYSVTVTAMDPAGLEDVITVTITVTGVNEPPDITGEVEPYAENDGGSVATFQTDDPENAGTVTLDLSGADASLFNLNQGGVLTFGTSPDYEMPRDADKDNVYEVTVGAKDDDGNRAARDVEVKVTNVDEAGTVTLSTLQPRVGVPLTASVTDIDGEVSGVKWQWSNSSGDIGDATSDTYTPTEANEGTLTAMATYTDPQGPGMASGTSTNPVAADTRNKPPMFDADQDTDTEGDQAEAKRSIEENAAEDASVGGGAVTATDPNSGDILTYTLGGPDASSFDIGSDNGQITVGAGTKLDFETKDTYMVTVIATDSFGATASIDVTITVTDVNEGPEIFRGGLAVSGLRSIEYAEDATGPVATYMASGPDAASATWTLDGDDAGEFMISSNGVLTFSECA